VCGIVGIRRFDGQPVAVDTLRRMAAALPHRGPDGEGFWVSGPVGFGHRRLSIIDVEGSPQPMATPDDRLHITFNGEIFNYQRLRSTIAYPYRTKGDTEVLLALFASEGVAGVRRLNGQFAYGVHDRAGDELWLVRDRLGVLPLFYYCDDRMLAFASEIKALLPALPVAPTVDEASLDDYLTRRSVAAPYTLFSDVRKLRPGHWLRASADGVVEDGEYWSVDTRRRRSVSAAEAVNLVGAGVRTAVKRAMVADVPVGALLSGGVDSSLIVALMTSLRDGAGVETFSAGFGDPRFDELPFARQVSQAFNTRHHEVVVEPGEFADLWPRLTWHRDAPISEPADVAVFRLAALARQSVKVLLSGEGSDELFGGYPKYRLARVTGALDVVPAAARARLLGAVARSLPARATRPAIALRAMAAPNEAERLASWFAPFTAGERRRFLGRAPLRPPAAEVDGRDAIQRMATYDCDGWLADNLLERGDRMSMAASVELRPPLLDHELVELAFCLPSRFKVHRGETKWVLKEVARRHLPSAIVERRKVGFRVPLDVWFRGHLRDLSRDLLGDPNSFVGAVFDRASVRALLDDHERGRRDESIRIWTLLSLEVWHQAFFKEPLRPPRDR